MSSEFTLYVRLRTFKTRAAYMLSNAKLRRRVQHKIRRQSYFDSVAEKMLREARNLSGKDKHISIVVGNPNFGTLQGWKGGGSPWRRLVNSICMIVRRRIAQKNEKWTIVQVDERWSTKQYVLRNISFTLDQSWNSSLSCIMLLPGVHAVVSLGIFRLRTDWTCGREPTCKTLTGIGRIVRVRRLRLVSNYKISSGWYFDGDEFEEEEEEETDE